MSTELPVILVVDDAPEIRVLLGTMLRSILSCEIVEAEDGAAGFEQAVRHAPALIVSDINMPLATGYDLCRAIRADARTRTIPIVLITGYTGEHTLETAMAAGASTFLAKPFPMDVLAYVLTQHLPRAARAA